MLWARYRKKWGGFNAMQRADRGFGMLATAFSGGKLEEWMPWPVEEDLSFEELEPATPEQLAAAFGAIPKLDAKRS